MKKATVFLLILALVLALGACGGTPSASPATDGGAQATPKPEEGGKDAEPEAAANPYETYWEATVYSQLANYAGIQTGWYGQLIKEKFNMGFNIIASNVEGGATKFATLMASGNLGDLVFFGGAEDLRSAIDAGMLLDWNENNLLAEHGPVFTELFEKALEKNRTLYGGGEKVYGIGHDVVPSDSALEVNGANDLWWGPYARWDLYKELGYPEVVDMEDYLPILRQMQDLEPTNSDGLPVYAFSLWADWDGDHMMAAKQFACLYGYDAYGFYLVHGIEDKYQDFLQEDSLYLRTLKFYYDANQLGLIDPDSLTQKNADVTAKEREGRVLFNWFSSILNNFNTAENVNAGRGIKLIPMKNQYTYGYVFNPYGGFRTATIGAKCKEPERVMDYLNWAYSDEGYIEVVNGPRGATWDIGPDNKPFLTELGWKCLDDITTEMPAEWGGGTFNDGTNKGTSVVRAATSMCQLTGTPFGWRQWPVVLERDPDPVTVDWRAKMNATTSKEYLANNDKICKTINQAVFSQEPDLIIDEMLKQKHNQIGTVICQYSWKMVYANSEAEFEQLKAEMIDKANGLGYEEVQAFYKLVVEKLFADRAAMQ